MNRLLFIFMLLFPVGGMAQVESETFQITVKEKGAIVKLRMNEFDYSRYNRSITEKYYEIDWEKASQIIEFQRSTWEVTKNVKEVNEGSFDVSIHWKLVKGSLENAAPSVDFFFSDWMEENYVLMPAAVYNGNRFDSRKIRYSPKPMDARDYGPDKSQLVSDIPRLNIKDGQSKIQERSGAMSLPSAGFFSPSKQMGFWMFFPQANEMGDYGITIEENRNREKFTMSLTSPVVRETYKYIMTDNQFPSSDPLPKFKEGDEISFKMRLFFFDSKNIQGIYDKFFNERKSYLPEKGFDYFYPLSSCFEVLQKKFNEQNFYDTLGYYAIGIRNSNPQYFQDWQIGWVGGMISTYPLLFDGDEETRKNVISNFDWLFRDGQGICPAGFFWDAGESHGEEFTWIGGDTRKMNTKNWHLIRKSGDAVYYIVKQFMLMDKMGIPVKEEWKKGIRTVSDALVKLWEDNGQFGQFVDSQTGEIAVGGSTSAAIVPAAMVLAADYFENETYKEMALEAAEHFYHTYITKGLTYGGVGDAMQNPDSESSYAMLESFALLYEKTGDKKWLKYAEEMASQFATWVMAYDYAFPKNSLFGKRGVQTMGSVFANTQNKHSSPGICTHSGVALLRLYKATDNEQYMELLQDITRHLSQPLSHPLKPVEGIGIGWMNERVNTTDWLEGIGEIFPGSTWAETALMLTYTEIPGLYVRPQQGYYCVFDHIEVKKLKASKKNITLELYNPNAVEAHVKVLVETEKEAVQVLEENRLYNTEIITLKPGEKMTKVFR